MLQRFGDPPAAIGLRGKVEHVESGQSAAPSGQLKVKPPPRSILVNHQTVRVLILGFEITEDPDLLPGRRQRDRHSLVWRVVRFGVMDQAEVFGSDWSGQQQRGQRCETDWNQSRTLHRGSLIDRRSIFIRRWTAG